MLPSEATHCGQVSSNRVGTYALDQRRFSPWPPGIRRGGHIWQLPLARRRVPFSQVASTTPQWPARKNGTVWQAPQQRVPRAAELNCWTDYY